MSVSELKLELFRKIDNLSDDEIRQIYKILMSFINTDRNYRLSSREESAIDEAISARPKTQALESEEVMSEAKRKYKNLRFR